MVSSCAQGNPSQTIYHSCDTSKSSVTVIVAHKSCPSALDFIKGVNVLLGIWIPGSGCVVKSGLYHGAVSR